MRSAASSQATPSCSTATTLNVLAVTKPRRRPSKSSTGNARHDVDDTLSFNESNRSIKLDCNVPYKPVRIRSVLSSAEVNGQGIALIFDLDSAVPIDAFRKFDTNPFHHAPVLLEVRAWLEAMASVHRLDRRAIEMTHCVAETSP